MHPDIDALLFSLELSARYHRARRDFLDGVAKFLDVVSLLSAGGLVLLMVSELPYDYKDSVELALSVVLLFFAIISVIAAPSKAAMIHQDFVSKFRRLKSEVSMIEAKSKLRHDEVWVGNQLAKWRSERETIEEFEPAIYCALQDEVYYGLCVALGRTPPKNHRPGYVKRRLRHIFRFDNTARSD